MHILPPGFRWRSAAVNEVIRQSDELVMEISDREMMEGAQPLLLQRMMLGKTVPLAARVSPGRREALRRMLDELGLPAEGFSEMHSWAAALLIMAMAAMQGMAGGEGEPVDPEQMSGVEDGLESEFRALNRPIAGVETVDEQIGFFSNLSFAQQRELLEALIDEYASASGDLSENTDIDQWVSGDVEAIAINENDLPPMLYDVLIPRRNRAWTDWLIARLERPGTVLFAVGAGHLAGRDSVQTMLASRGFTVTRLH